ncbi:MAG: NUDIX domain-containing protein [Paracoccaceae bacterium]
MTDLSTYAKPSVAVDLAIMTVLDGRLKVLLVRRPEGDVAGYAMPGGFVRIEDSLETTVERVLAEKVGIDDVHFEQLATYGTLGRDPRGRVISIVYLALCSADTLQTAATGGRVLVNLLVDWSDQIGGPARVNREGSDLSLSFDHADILGDVVQRLRGKLDYSSIAFALLPDTFTLRAVQEVHEAILARPLTKPPFRRKLLDRGLIQPTGALEAGGAFRPAALYELKSKD